MTKIYTFPYSEVVNIISYNFLQNILNYCYHIRSLIHTGLLNSVWLGTELLNFFFLHIDNQRSEHWSIAHPSLVGSATSAIYQVSMCALIYFNSLLSSIGLFIFPRTMHSAFIVHNFILFIVCNKYLYMVRRSPYIVFVQNYLGYLSPLHFHMLYNHQVL